VTLVTEEAESEPVAVVDEGCVGRSLSTLRGDDAVILALRCLLVSLLHDRVDQEGDSQPRNNHCYTVDWIASRPWSEHTEGTSMKITRIARLPLEPKAGVHGWTARRVHNGQSDSGGKAK
jgi:hypothetical protein